MKGLLRRPDQGRGVEDAAVGVAALLGGVGLNQGVVNGEHQPGRGEYEARYILCNIYRFYILLYYISLYSKHVTHFGY